MTEIEILPPSDPTEANQLLVDVDALLDSISNHEFKLASSYARLGALLTKVEASGAWMELGFEKFSSYLESIRTKIDRKRSQLYNYLSVAKALLPYMSETYLEDIGITKANELRRFVLERGSDPWNVSIGDTPLMDMALDPKVRAVDLRVAINQFLHIHELPLGSWLELGGFYADLDERKEIEQFWELSKSMQDLQADTPEHAWKKQSLLMAIREFVGTYSGVSDELDKSF